MKLVKLTENDMQVFKHKKVIIVSKDETNVLLYKIFKYFDIEVLGFYCMYRPSVFTRMWLRRKGFNYLDEAKINKLKVQNNIIVQSLDERDESVNCKLRTLGFEISELNSGQIISAFSALHALKSYENIFNYWHKVFCWKYKCNNRTLATWERFKKQNFSDIVIMCSPPKTADYSMDYTIEKCNKNLIDNGMCDQILHYANVYHLPRLIQKKFFCEKYDTIKIITGIREPIGQNLSRMFEDIASGTNISNWCLGDLYNCTYKERKEKLKEYKYLFVEHGDDIQLLWESYVERYIYDDKIFKPTVKPKTVQYFLNEFSKYVIDILQYPFDKEKGYSIIKDGKVEVFVYQLEKLNDIVPQLSEWLGVAIKEIERGNIGEQKWLGSSYKQALDEIEITQEYFDRCYNEPYVKHCYSEQDIEKFKSRWKSHIRNS